MDNICLLTDGYKLSHYVQYPPGTEYVYSYFEARRDFPITFFGLQYILQKHLEGVRVSKEDVEQAHEFSKSYFGQDLFNYDGWMHIVNEHGGRLPVEIKAVDEGTVVPGRNVLMTVVNTDPQCYWLTNYLETILTHVWYPCTIATNSRSLKRVIEKSIEKTGSGNADFKLHDFGFRGVTCVEQAGIGGAAHLLYFKGSDTLAASELLMKYYMTNRKEMPSFSIPASEHSTITSWGKHNECEAMRNMLRQYPTGTVACVSDSYDITQACLEYWGRELKDEVIKRDGVLVIRPDSGHPPDSVLHVLECLGTAFGWRRNEKGHKVLPDKIRVIQGDGIDFEMVEEILWEITSNGWSIDNLAFGSGGGLLQKFSRDDQNFAFKCSAIRVNGEWRPVYKSPKGCSDKNSKRGRFVLLRDRDGSYQTVVGCPEIDYRYDQLQTVFKDGYCTNFQDFSSVTERANQ